MSAVRDALSYVFERVPWLGPVLAWSVAFLLLLAVLSVPAYFFLKPLFRLIRRALSRWSLDLANRHRMAGAARARKLDEAAGAYQRDNLLKRVLNAGQSIHAELAHRVRWQLRRLRKAMRGAGKSLDKLARQSGELRNAMLAISASSGGAGALPPQPEMLSETEALRKAHMRLTVSSLLVAALVFVNTGMLSQILRDLNIIPPSYAVLGIPLFYFLALMITLIEAGLGFVHGILSENEPGEEEKIHFGAWAVVLAAMGIACVEGFFYSRISPDRTRIVTIPIVNYGVPEPDIFFIWGFLLVMTLFLLGLMWYRAFSSVLHGSAPRKLYKTLGRIRSRAADCESAVRESLGIVKTAQETLSKDSGGTVDRTALEELRKELDRLESQAGRAAAAQERDLTVTEVLQLANAAGFWICLALVTGGTLVLLGLDSFHGLLAGLDERFYWFLAVGQVLAFFGAGVLLASGEVVVKADAGVKVEAPPWARMFGIAVAALLIVTYLWLMLSSPRASGTALILACDFLVGVLMAAAGYKLTPLLGVASLWFQRVKAVLAGLAEFLVRVVLALLLGIATVLEFIVRLLAAPIQAIVNGRRSRAAHRPEVPPPHTAAA